MDAPSVSHVKPPLAKRFKRTVRFALVRAALALASLLPLPLAQRCGDVLGSLAFRLLRKERHKALASLQRAFPEKPEPERWALARACFRHLGRCALEAAVARRLSAAQLDALVEVPLAVRTLLLGAVARGRGVVAVSGHVGHWELFGWVLVRLGVPLHVVARPGVDARLGTLAEDFRAQGGVRTILRGSPGSARGMLSGPAPRRHAGLSRRPGHRRAVGGRPLLRRPGRHPARPGGTGACAPGRPAWWAFCSAVRTGATA